MRGGEEYAPLKGEGRNEGWSVLPAWTKAALIVLIIAFLASLAALILLLFGRSCDGDTLMVDDRCPFQDQLATIDANLIPMYKSNRDRLRSQFMASTGVIFLAGGTEVIRNDDVTTLFRQESNFYWATGINEPDMSMAIDLATNITTLFVPYHDAFYAIWNGVVMTPEQIMQLYGVDQVYYSQNFSAIMDTIQPPTIYVLAVSDLPSDFVGNFTYNVDNTTLYNALMASRTIKSSYEIYILSLAATIASWAHNMTMKKAAYNAANGITTYEYDLESFFLFLSYNCRARQQAYTGIVGGGSNGAILHYIANDDVIDPSSLVLSDMGPELWGYASDVTRTFPFNGQFSDLQKTVYQMVLVTQDVAIAMLKPGTNWSSVQRQSLISVGNQLLQAGLVQGTIDQLMNASIPSLFLPHGVGHFLGLDVHDTLSIRTLAPGMVLTVEPGVYFNAALLVPAFADPIKSQYLVQSEINKYMNLGGVRIEDDFLITETGYQQLSDSPRSIADIENLMLSGWV